MNESIVVTVILIVLGIGLIGTGALIRIMYGRKYKVVMGTVEKTEVHLRSEEVDYMEGILVASKIADRVGITRSVIVNALRKLDSAGVIVSKSSGMKGTYIKVTNELIYEEIDNLKRER